MRGLEAAKGLGRGLATPVKFALSTGHFSSSLRRRPVDSIGRPVPWYTLPAVAFLSSLDYRGARILEFGGGHSTLWWAARAESVTTVEGDARWFRRLQDLTKGFPNVHVRLATTEDEYARPPEGKYDVVVIDGGPRHLLPVPAMAALRDDGIIIVDNSQGNWGSRTGGHPIIDALQGGGFARVDFHGFVPGVYHQECTSIFFRSMSRFKNLPAPPKSR